MNEAQRYACTSGRTSEHGRQIAFGNPVLRRVRPATALNTIGNAQTADQVLPKVAILGGTGPGQSYFDPRAFGTVTGVRYGTAGLNILRGPGVFNMDLGLFRQFAITERIKVQFRAEAFNATNTNQFPRENFVNNANNANFGSIIRSSAAAGNGRPRNIQLAVKAIW